MHSIRIYERRRAAVVVATTVVSLAVTTVLVSGLEERLGVPNASSVYLLAVVAVAVAAGTVAAALAAIGSFLLYNFLFTQPLYTFTVADPGEWVNLILLLVIGIVVGQLAAAQRNRAEAAELREREARALFEVSWALTTRDDTTSALASIVETLRRETGASRAWITLATDGGKGRQTADSDAASAPARPASYAVLKRMPGEEPATWVRVRDPVVGARSAPDGTHEVYRVNVEAAGRTLGALWTKRPRASRPSREETRMLAAAADQIGQALEQDRLRADATSAELARRSDALKTALLDSVSHDLRTPLASIRAAAGSLMDRRVRWSPEDRERSAQTIDREAERLNRLVTNLLDMSRIEAGGLRAEPEPYPVEDLVMTTLRRFSSTLQGHAIDVAIPSDLPVVEVDPTFMDQILTNLIENALRYTPASARIQISAGPNDDDSTIRLLIEDGGPGVPEEAYGHLFEKFYRVPRRGEGSRRGTGVGLAVVRGLVETMGGTVEARRSELGGLAIAMDLPRAKPQPAPAIAAGAAS